MAPTPTGIKHNFGNTKELYRIHYVLAKTGQVMIKGTNTVGIAQVIQSLRATHQVEIENGEWNCEKKMDNECCYSCVEI